MRSYLGAMYRGVALAPVFLLTSSLGGAKEEAYGTYVIGVEPSTAEIRVDAGRLRDDGTFNGGVSPFEFQVPVNHYVIGRAKADTVHGIVSVRIDGEYYHVCGSVKSPTFTVAEGKAVYLGELTVEARNGRLLFRLVSDLELAKLQIGLEQPELAARLEPGELVSKRVKTACSTGTVITIPVYIP
jgi:hypothetical protein